MCLLTIFTCSHTLYLPLAVLFTSDANYDLLFQWNRFRFVLRRSALTLVGLFTENITFSVLFIAEDTCVLMLLRLNVDQVVSND